MAGVFFTTMTSLSLIGKRALVCGASRGIGKAAALALASEGASCILLGRNQEALLDVLQQLDTVNGQQHSTLVADQNELVSLASRIETKVMEGNIHIWINNTGGPKGGALLQADPTELSAAFLQHILAAQTILQAVYPGMKQDGYGRIINVISTSVKQPIPGLGVSNTIRGAMASWAKTLAGELGPDGITVNNVLPGFTDTDRLGDIISSRAIAQGKTEEQIASTMKAGVPARRFAQPEETARAIAFLASPDAAYINGINLPVDGGRTTSL